jgi:hypothetical protein
VQFRQCTSAKRRATSHTCAAQRRSPRTRSSGADQSWSLRHKLKTRKSALVVHADGKWELHGQPLFISAECSICLEEVGFYKNISKKIITNVPRDANWTCVCNASLAQQQLQRVLGQMSSCTSSCTLLSAATFCWLVTDTDTLMYTCSCWSYLRYPNTLLYCLLALRPCRNSSHLVAKLLL